MRNFLKSPKITAVTLVASMILCTNALCAEKVEMCKEYNKYLPNYRTKLNNSQNQDKPIMMKIEQGRFLERGIIDVEAEVYPECYGDSTVIRVTKYDQDGYKKNQPHKFTILLRDDLDRIIIKTSYYDKKAREVVKIDAIFIWEQKWNSSKRTIGGLVYGKKVFGTKKGYKPTILEQEHVRSEIIEALELQEGAKANFENSAKTTSKSKRPTYYMETGGRVAQNQKVSAFG